MNMKKKPLTPEQLEDAKRLKSILTLKERVRPVAGIISL